MRKEEGITLIELIIVISIIGILAVALGFEYTNWIGKYRVESQMKDLYTDLMNARARAMQRNRIHIVRFHNSTSYSIYEDDSDGATKVPDGDGILQIGSGDGADTQLPTFPKSVEFSVDWNNSAIAAPLDLIFHNNGTIDTISLGRLSIYVDKDNDGERDFVPDYDCIEILQTRINMGALDDKGTSSKNDDECVAK